MFDEGLEGIIAQNKREKKWMLIKKLSKLKKTVKFDLKKLNDHECVVVPNFPFKLKILTDVNDGLCKFFRFEKCLQDNSMLASNLDYTSENIKEVANPFSVIERHCNITEYSYTNRDNHPHLHKHDELLHISFVDNFYDTPVYKEISKEIMFIPLRKGLREIREIILIPLAENGKEIKELKDIVYLILKEE